MPIHQLTRRLSLFIGLRFGIKQFDPLSESAQDRVPLSPLGRPPWVRSWEQKKGAPGLYKPLTTEVDGHIINAS